jgi:Xaa-Pro aminopeptidase
MATANRLQDLTIAALTPGRTGNEVLAAARAAAAEEDIDGEIYSHPVGYHGHGAGPAIGQWDRQDGVPGPGDYPVHLNTVYALELAIRRPVPEWDGQVVRMAVEDGIAVTGDGVRYLAERQTELIPIR